MANPEHLILFGQGKAVWNEWRQVNLYPSTKPDLSGIDLHDEDLSGWNLRKINLSGANLSRTKLSKMRYFRKDSHPWPLDPDEMDLYVDFSQVDLSGANLREADLRKVNLSQADLSRADLSGADLREATLGRADLSQADLSRADLSKAKLMGTIFVNINLAEVRNLDACRHVGPSFLDFRTLQQSGPLPLAFLRGCGLPDLLINYLPSLLNQPIQYYSCFISYSTKDEDFARRLHADLQNQGGRCWFTPHDIQGGRKLYEQIFEAIQLQDRLLLVLSEHSMNSECEWVRTEIAEARQREVREKRQVLFPIRLVDYESIKQWKCFDADTGKDSAREIREYFVPDFSNWKSYDAYQQSFDRLLRDLKPALEHKPEPS